MIKWFKKKVKYFFETWEEADSLDPWRGFNAKNPKGIRLFDLAYIHFKDSGYYPRLYRNSNMIVIFSSKWRRFVDRRVGAIAFEVGHSYNAYDAENADRIWCFGFGQPYSLHAGNSSVPRAHMMCKISDPFCLDVMLERIDKHYLKA